MKKKYLIISISILLVLSTCLYVFISGNTNRVVISSEKINENILNTNALTMMYETDYQSGEYQVSSDSAWPESGYVFNETLSKCENGSKMYWDSNTNRVMMEANTADKCYVYFDVYRITFNIGNTEYYAEEGMTWQDWIDSDYSDFNFTISDNYVLVGLANKITLDGLLVNFNDEILSNTKYLLRCEGDYSVCPLEMHLSNTFYDFQYLSFTYREHFNLLYEFDDSTFGGIGLADLILEYVYDDQYTFSEFIDEISNLGISILNPLENYNNVITLSNFFYLSENEETENAINDDGNYFVALVDPYLTEEYSDYVICILHFSAVRAEAELIYPDDVSFAPDQIEFTTEDLGLFKIFAIKNDY